MAISTIGYGSRRFADLASLLKEQHIIFIVDVRRFPKSTMQRNTWQGGGARLRRGEVG